MFFYRIPPQILTVTQNPLKANLIFKNPYVDRRELACAKGDPLTRERLEEIHNRIDKGEALILAESELEEFLCEFDFREEIEKENEKELTIRKLQETNQAFFKSNYEDKGLDVVTLMGQLRQNEDFSILVKAAKAQVEAFSMQESSYFSFLISFCSSLFSRSGELPNSAAFCFLFAQKLRIDSPIELMEITTAYALRELGLSYLEQNEQRELSPEYTKYPLYTQHLISLSCSPFSKQVSRYILEHRELANGNGFPRQKEQDQTHFNSFIIGICHELFKQYYTKQNGKEFNKALRLLGVNNAFPEEITSGLISFAR